jgi:hypothetical protein
VEKLFRSFLLKYQASNIHVTLSLSNVTLGFSNVTLSLSKGDLKRGYYFKLFKSGFDILTMTSITMTSMFLCSTFSP